MKSIFAVIFLLCAVAGMSSYAGNAIKFDDYRKLSAEDRQKLAKEATPELLKQYARWNQIIDVQGEPWKERQAADLILSKGLESLNGLSNLQQRLFGTYELKAIAANKKSGMTKEAEQARFDALEAEDNAINKQGDIDEWYLVRIAPTPQAHALNEKANALIMGLYKRFPDGQEWTVTRQDLDAVTAAMKPIRDQIKQLPQLTREQMESALAAAPVREDEPPGMPHR